MERLGFTREDLAVFGVESSEGREKVFRERLRPRLEEIAYRVTAPLSRVAGGPLAAVITLPAVTDARAEAAASFVPEGADLATAPYLTFALTRGGVHARFVIDRRLQGREVLAKRLTKEAAGLAKDLSSADVRCYDAWDGRGIPPPGLPGKAPFWRDVAERLGRVDGRLDVGLGWPEARAVLLSFEDLLPAFRALMPVYRRVMPEPRVRRAGQV